MARFGRTGAEIIEERKRKLLEQQRLRNYGTIRTGEDILRSRGKPSSIDETFFDVFEDYPTIEPYIPEPEIRPAQQKPEIPKITPSIVSSNIPKEEEKPSSIKTFFSGLWDRVKSWFSPDPDVVRKSVFGVTYEDELEEAAKEYVRRTTETPAGQFGTSFLRSASMGVFPRVVEAITPEKTREEFKKLGYESVQDIYNAAQQKGGLISAAGSIIGSLVPLSKISQASKAILNATGLAGKSPFLAKSLESVLTGALYGAGVAAGEGEKPVDIAKSAGRSALFVAAGGLASDIVGGAGRALLKHSALKNSLPADIVLNIIQGAVFGAAGTAATMPTYSKDERPGTREVLTSAVTMALFSAIPATINSIQTSKANKKFLYNAMQQFEQEAYGLYNAARANRVTNPEEALKYYRELLNYLNNNKMALQQNRYLGQGKVVKAATELIDKLSEFITAEMDMVAKGAASTLHRFIGPSQASAQTTAASPTVIPPIVPVTTPQTEPKAEPVRPIPVGQLGPGGVAQSKPQEKPKETQPTKITVKQAVEQYTKDMDEKEKNALNKYAINLSNDIIKDHEKSGSILTPDQVSEIISGSIKIGRDLIENIKNKNFDVLVDRLHLGNKHSLRLFTDITGLSTITQKEIDKSIRSLDADAYDKWLEGKKLEKQKRKEQQEQEAMENELQKMIQFRGETITKKEFIDKIISEGYTEVTYYKKGAIPTLRLGKGILGFDFQNKYEKKYIEKAISELPKKTKEPEPIAETKHVTEPVITETKPITEPKPIETKTIEKNVSQIVADRIKFYLREGKSFTADKLFEIANEVYGGTQAEGKYTVKDAYDAMELAVNQYILETPDYRTNVSLQGATETIKKLQEILSKLPTQTKRTEEMERFQQYSTPPSIAYIANWVANITNNDVVLEPSAGIGGLAVFAKKEGAKVIVNELSQRRLEVLKQMGFDKEFNFDAEQIDNLLPDDIKPTVVVMNPPFSSAALRMGDKTTTANAKRHIQQALNRLEDGGRLVAIVGQGMADNAPAFKEWWKEIKSKYNVRANIGIDGENYRKYGTSFDIQLVVIDKTGPTTGTTLTGKVKDLTELPKLLEGIKNDRTTTSIRQVEQDQVVPGSEKAPGQSRPNVLVSPPGSREGTSNVLPKESEGSSISEPRPEAVDTETYPGQSVSVKPKESIRTDDTATRRRTDVTGPDGREVEGGQTVRTDTGYRDKSVREHEPVRSVQDTGTGVVIEKPAEDVKVEINEDDVYTAYRPKKLNVKGAHPHVTELVESAAMAAVDPPDVTYTPNLPEELITSGKLSIAQLENIVYAGQAHSQVLPNGFRKGYFIGDGTGVGKGRQIAGIILDNFRQGRKKAVWISNDPKLYYDAIRDWTDLGQNKNDIINLSKIKSYKPIDIESGIIYASYATLRSSSAKNPDVTRVKQIVDWLGKDFDGVIVFDEAHNMSNAIEYGRGLKKSKVVKQALAGMDLQNALPNARIVYASATGATNVHNLAYLTRLGLWGEGTAFMDVNDFISKIASGGLAAMEVVARDMKSMGVYTARNLSFKGVEYETLEHELTPIQTEIYNTMSRAWQKVLQNMYEALDITGANKDSGAVGRAKAQFYGAMQRFYNQIITSMSMPSVIEDIKKELANGNAVVIQLVNTNQAATDRQIANANEKELDLDSIDLTPSDTLIEYLKKSFPVYEYEEYVDENGNKRTRIVEYNGKPVISKEAVRMRDALIEEIKEMKIPDGPLEMLFDAFGVDNVAEVTGRTSRIVPKKDEKTGEIKRVLEKRSASHAIADTKAFQDGKKLILVFSDAGGTGKSYHADRKAKNQRKRIHYLLQPGWSAYKATQGLGRTHRSGQVTPPLFKLVTTNIMGQKRFMSTIARRLDQMGALTKGQRQAGSGVFSERDNLENPIATEALVQFYKDVIKDRTLEIGIDAKTLFTKMGLIDKFITDKYGNLVENYAIMQDMNMFLNRILALEVEEQNNVFNAFYSRFNDLFDKKLAAGEVDVGLENYKAEKIELVDEKSIWKDKNTSAETKYLQLKALQRNKILNFKFVRNFRPNFIGLVRINNTGEVRAIYRTGNKTLSSGEIVPEYILLSPDYTTSRYVQPTVESRTTPIPESEWKKAWNEQISKTPEFREETIHMLSGTLLPVWNKLPLGYTKVMRVFTADGKEYLGRIIKEEDIDITLGNFGTRRQKESYTPEQIYNKIYNDGLTAILESNKVKLVRRKVSGEYRIEIIGNNVWFYARNIPGIITETINYKKRYFIPVGEKAVPIIKRIIDSNPVRSISNTKEAHDLESIEDTLADRIKVDDKGPSVGLGVKITYEDGGEPGTGEGEFKFSDPEIERRWQEAKRVKGPLLEEISTKLQTIWEGIKISTTRGAIPYLPRGSKYAQLRFNLIRFAKQKQVAMYRTLINLKGIVSSLDKTTYDLFSRKVALEDMIEEIEFGHDLAFGFDAETVKKEIERVNNEIEKYPEISEAIKLRRELWEAIKKEYIDIMNDINFPVADRLRRSKYYRHIIIDHIRADRVIPGVIKLRTPTGASYLKKRHGSLKDYVSDYLMAEAEVMANMLFDIEKAKLIKYVKDSEHNIKNELKAAAKDMNRKNLNDILEAEAKDENVPRNNRGEGPIQATLTEYNQYLAMSFRNIVDLANSNSLVDFGYIEFQDVIRNLASGMTLDIDDPEASAITSSLYRYLAIVASVVDAPGNISARTILKYTSLRRNFIKEVLGDKYVTWRDIIPKGYDIWQPREGNYLYIAYTIPEKIAEQLLTGLAETVNISAEQLNSLLVKGQPYEEFVLPDEVIMALDNLTKIKDEPLTAIAAKKLTDAWKQWQLISPRRVFKYNLRNLTGDLDAAISGNPKILTKVFQAINELFDVYYNNKPIKGTMWEWFYRGGMQSTLQVNEIEDINQLKMFVDLYKRKDKVGYKIIDLFKNYWKTARLSTDFREAILRYSAFLYAVEDLQKNNGVPSSYWASIKEEVDALSNIYDKAYMLSNDLLGAYDDISIFGQWLRKYAIPFYSWMEVNPKRYFRLIKNAITDDRTTINVGKRTLKLLGITGVKSLALLRRIGKLILYLFSFTALTQVWNLLFFPEEEKQLPRGVRSRTHIILGRDKETGDILYFSRIGAISDVLDWVGLDTAVIDMMDFLQGRLTLKEYLTQMIQSPLNKAVNAAYPYHKLAFELITGRKLFPDIFRQGQIRDAGLHIAQSLGLENEYKALAGLPQRKGSYLESLQEIFYYRTNPDEAAYWDIIDLKERYLERNGKPHGYVFWQDKKNKALYYLKVALRYKDKEAVDKYLYEYAAYGGTAKGLKQSLNSMDPLYGLDKVEIVEFISGLSEDDKDRLVRAKQFYEDTLNPDWDSAETDITILETNQE